MSETILFYDATGAIKSAITIPAGAPSQATPSGLTALTIRAVETLDKSFLLANYVTDGAVTPRTALSLTTNKTTLTANGTDEVTITGIPSGASAKITGAVSAGPETITDGELVITSTATGKINVSITLRPAYQDWSCVLTAS
jgi:hypothetical protein